MSTPNGDLQLEITLDETGIDQSFASIEKKAKSTSDKISQNLGDKKAGALSSFKDGIDESVLMFGTVAAAAVATGVTVKKALDFTLMGEATKAVQINFDNLARSANLAGDALSDAIVDATKGLIDDENAIQIATKGIVALGDAAERLPEVLNASRNIAKGLGKDFEQTFENLSGFIENGNAKVLKQYGLIIDTDKALKEYARSLGVSTDAISQQQQQIIRMNALLEKSAELFNDTTESATPLKDSIDRLSVSMGNLAEDNAVKLNEQFSPALTRIIDKFRELIEQGPSVAGALAFLTSPLQTTAVWLAQSAKAAEDFSNVGSRELATMSEKASAKLGELNAKMAEYNRLAITRDNPLAAQSLQSDITAAQAELDRINNEIEKRSHNAALAGAGKVGGGSAGPNPDDELNKKIVEGRKQREAELTKFLNDQKIQRMQADLATVNATQSVNQQETSLLLLQQQQTEILAAQHAQKLRDINTQFSDEKFFTQQQRDAAALAQEQTFAAQKLQVEQDTADKIAAIREKEAKDNQIWAQFTADTWAATALTAKKTLAVGVGNAFADFGKALGRGENASQAFADAIGKTLSQAAANLGNFFIQSGLGRLAVSYGADGTGYAMLAAGIALNALAGAMGGSTSTPTGDSGGGGIVSTPSENAELTPTENLQKPDDTPRIQVTIQGDVLDSDESGSRIVDLINRAFDRKGVVLNQVQVT